MCSEKKIETIFEPCGHACACDNCASILKKCVQCRTPIDQIKPILLTYSTPVQNNRNNLKINSNTTLDQYSKPKLDDNFETSVNNNGKKNSEHFATWKSTSLSNSNCNQNVNHSRDHKNRDSFINHDVQKLQQQLQDIKDQVSLVNFKKLIISGLPHSFFFHFFSLFCHFVTFP